MRTDRYKLLHHYRKAESKLYDPKNGPKELNSVSGQPAYAKVQTRLKRKLNAVAS
jgi:hypothetical protein